jgi:D-inositol-3-phosphate glycosyltransferase
MTMTLHVALVSEHASPLAALGGADAGGQNVHVAALAEALDRLGCRVTVHTRRDDPDLPARVRVGERVVVDHVDAGPPQPIPKDELLPHMTAFRAALAARWRRRRPDVVHAHFWMSGMAALAAARPRGIPVAQTFHALGAVKRRHQGRADTSPRERLGVERDLIRRADAIVATCRDEQAELVALGGDADRIEVIPCGIDTLRFTPDGRAEPRPPGGRVRFVTVGRLVPRKGVDDTIRALAAVPGAELVVVGGPAAHELDRDPEVARLRAIARDAGVADRVDLRGRLPHDAVAEVLRSADAAVCAPWYEPFGIVPVEAMACGLPVVGTAVGGLLDTVIDGATGVLVPPRSPVALAEAMRAMAESPERRRSMGAVASARSRALYDWRLVASRTCDVYAALAGPAAAAAHPATASAAAMAVDDATTAVSA